MCEEWRQGGKRKVTLVYLLIYRVALFCFRVGKLMY